MNKDKLSEEATIKLDEIDKYIKGIVDGTKETAIEVVEEAIGFMHSMLIATKGEDKNE